MIAMYFTEIVVDRLIQPSHSHNFLQFHEFCFVTIRQSLEYDESENMCMMLIIFPTATFL